MKVITHDSFHQVYTGDPAASRSRIQAIVDIIQEENIFEEATHAAREDIDAVHTKLHIDNVVREGLYSIAALAAGATIQAALIGLSEPCFALVRPPGHHASADYAWGFCYFNNMAIAIEHLRKAGKIRTAHVLDFDLHYGDGTVSIFNDKNYVSIHNPESRDRTAYLQEVRQRLSATQADIIGVSAGFDHHVQDWGGLLHTEDYGAMGQMVRETCRQKGIGCFAALEGGYNHQVLGYNVQAFLRGLEGK